MSEGLDSLERLFAEFRKLPGIGARTAERLAYHILRASKEDAMALAYAIRDVKKNMRNCTECFNLTERELCSDLLGHAPRHFDDMRGRTAAATCGRSRRRRHTRGSTTS